MLISPRLSLEHPTNSAINSKQAMEYISIHLYRKVVHYAISEGLSAEDLSGLPTPIQEMDSLQAVPADHFFQLHEHIDGLLHAGFSVRVGQEMKMDDYGVLGLSWKTCSWAGEIFDRSERYFKLLSNTYYFQVEKGPSISKVYLLREAYRRGVELSNESTLSASVVVLQAMTQSTIAPIQVAFKHAEPTDLKSYHEAFNCELLFNQTHNYIAYHTSDLLMRTAKADESINRFLMERVKEETEGIQIGSNKLEANLRQLIQDALPSGIPAIDDISKQVGLSSRTLSRRLAASQLNFRELLQSTIEEQAKFLLQNSENTIQQIAFQTGFSEQSAFNRAFKRWTNLSPLEFRKQKRGK